MNTNVNTSISTKDNDGSKCLKKKKKRKLYFNDLLHIHQHTFFKYMIQSVIEEKIRRQICLYTIFP